ncbi:MAG: ComF family protein [Methylococcaceae bacterium]
MVNNWKTIVQDWLYPPTCLLCGDPGAHGLDLCLPCMDSLPYNTLACSRCALPLTSRSEHLLCGQCQQDPPAYDSAEAVFRYEQPVCHLIQALKFGGRHACARTLGLLLAERVSQQPEHPEVIVPVPLHPRRYWERGFNQSAEIATELSRHLGIPMDVHLATRIRHTPAQAGLSAKDRKLNLRKAFRIRTHRLPAHIAIVDDVVTTGTTVNELAAALRKAGVRQIAVWAVARVGTS